MIGSLEGRNTTAESLGQRQRQAHAPAEAPKRARIAPSLRRRDPTSVTRRVARRRAAAGRAEP